VPENKKLERIVEFTPAFDKRDPNPRKNYGIYGVELRFVVKGGAGAVQFLIFTNWHLPKVRESMVNRKYHHATDLEVLFSPVPVGVSYHSKFPRYPDQEISTKECEYCGGQPCYFDGSSLNAEKVFSLLVEKGDEAVWEFLEEYYNEKVRPTPIDLYLESIGEDNKEV
jgi:hypothetical protein